MSSNTIHAVANSFSGKVAVITGGSTGIGLATAQRLAASGATVYIAARSAADLEKAKGTVTGKVIPVVTDVSNLSSIEALFAQVKKEQGSVDILFANAGM